MSPKDYIGRLVVARLHFYDSKMQRMNVKARPVLVIGVESNSFPCDLTVLPVSKISHSQNIHDVYDVPLLAEDCVLLKLTHTPSYVRTHKQSYVHSTDIRATIISNLKDLLPEKYEEIQLKHQLFHAALF